MNNKSLFSNVSLFLQGGNMRSAVFMVFGLLVSGYAYSQDDGSLIDVYLTFERAYLEKDIDKLSGLLSDEYLLTSIIFVENKMQTSRIQTKSELLARLSETSHIDNQSGVSLKGNLQIINLDQGGFCCQSLVEIPTRLEGDRYKENELREVCFIKSEGGFKANKHRLEFIYRRIK